MKGWTRRSFLKRTSAWFASMAVLTVAGPLRALAGSLCYVDDDDCVLVSYSLCASTAGCVKKSGPPVQNCRSRKTIWLASYLNVTCHCCSGPGEWCVVRVCLCNTATYWCGCDCVCWT